MRLIVRQIEQGAHYIRKSLIYSMRKAFLEHAVVELVYKFDEKSYRERFRKLSFEVSSINSKPQSVAAQKLALPHCISDLKLTLVSHGISEK